MFHYPITDILQGLVSFNDTYYKYKDKQSRVFKVNIETKNVTHSRWCIDVWYKTIKTHLLYVNHR